MPCIPFGFMRGLSCHYIYIYPQFAILNYCSNCYNLFVSYSSYSLLVTSDFGLSVFFLEGVHRTHFWAFYVLPFCAGDRATEVDPLLLVLRLLLQGFSKGSVPYPVSSLLLKNPISVFVSLGLSASVNTQDSDSSHRQSFDIFRDFFLVQKYGANNYIDELLFLFILIFSARVPSLITVTPGYSFVT